MIVWVVEHGVYAERGVAGVYASAELAMKANPIREGAQRFGDREPGWTKTDDLLEWDNGCDMGDAVSVTGYEVEGL